MRNRGQVLARERLLDLARGDEAVVTDRTVDTFIKRLRRKFCDVDGPAWSPELGVKVARWEGDNDNAAVHLLVRAQIAPELNQVRRAGLLLGFTFF